MYEKKVEQLQIFGDELLSTLSQFRELQYSGSEEGWRCVLSFASELSGISVDGLLECLE